MKKRIILISCLIVFLLLVFGLTYNIAISAGWIKYKFRFDAEEIQSITIADWDNNQTVIDSSNYQQFIDDLKALDYKSCPEQILGRSEHTVIITLKNNDKIKLDAHYIKVNSKMKNYYCDVKIYNELINKYLNL